MHIYGPSQLHAAHSINNPHAARYSQPSGTSLPSSQTDEVSFSAEALRAGDAQEITGRLNDLPEIRQERVNSIRAAIANGTYETAGKLDSALERLLDEIG